MSQTMQLIYPESGVSLCWLIDPQERKVHIYRAKREVEILDNPERVSGESVIEGFVLELENIFD